MEMLQQKTQEETPILLVFHADWCGPCQTMTPIIDAVQAHFGAQLRIQHVDVDKMPAIVSKYKVSSVPTLILFKSGEIEWRVGGVQTKAEITTRVERLI